MILKKYFPIILLILKFLVFIALYVLLVLLNAPHGLEILWFLLLQVIGILAIVFCFIGFHEFGHFVFGILSGYSLTLFKIGPFEFVREHDGKIHFHFGFMNGVVLGQCLMFPPKPRKKKQTPFFWYNAGGLIFSYLMLFVEVALYFIPNIYLRWFMIPAIVISLFLCYQNSIYIPNGFNDVSNAHFIRKNKKYIDSLMYQLEVSGNILRGKRYGAKTMYNGYYEDKLNHISIPVVQFKYYHAIDHLDLIEATKYYELLNDNYYNVLLPIQRALINLDLMWGDLVLKKSFSAFKRHFMRMTNKEILYCERNMDADLGIIYQIFKKINQHNFQIEQDIEKLITEASSDGEALSLKKRFDLLVQTLKEEKL